jgi:hypothetical protein
VHLPGAVRQPLFDQPKPDKRPHDNLSPKNKCLNPMHPDELVGQLDHDITDLTILIEPYDPSRPRDRLRVDPAMLADFNDAKAGPITGVPPGDYLPK